MASGSPPPYLPERLPKGPLAGRGAHRQAAGTSNPRRGHLLHSGASGHSRPQQEWSFIAVRGRCAWEGGGQLPQEYRRAHSYHCLQGPGILSCSCFEMFSFTENDDRRMLFLTYSSTNSRKHSSVEGESALPAFPSAASPPS